jgi:hypothetical protein
VHVKGWDVDDDYEYDKIYCRDEKNYKHRKKGIERTSLSIRVVFVELEYFVLLLHVYEIIIFESIWFLTAKRQAIVTKVQVMNDGLSIHPSGVDVTIHVEQNE